jgi:Endonuclease/Exonuclease/phosphatase family
MKISKFFFVSIILKSFFGFTVAFAQQEKYPFQASTQFNDSMRGTDKFRLVFWNVENLFDVIDDPLTNDQAFTPEGENHWTFYRFKEKIKNLSKTLISTGGWDPTDFIGLCEIENREVLEALIEFSPLKNAGYQIIHENSNDARGIDVAAIYRTEKFNLLFYNYIRIVFPFDPDGRTRDILYVQGVLPNADTLHLFINHWPSRYGGQFETDPKRQYAAKVVREKVDELLSKNINASIVIMGDFNDHPDDISMKEVLNAKLTYEELAKNDLYNLMAPMQFKFGTHSFEGKWGVLDQFVVTSALYQGRGLSKIVEAKIYDAPWLIKLNAQGNTTANRMYQGPQYLGGYADHLPILLDINLEPSAIKND